MTSQVTGSLAATLARNVRDARTAANLSQRKLAEKLDTDSSLVSKWERGVHRPSDENVAEMAEKLHIELDWFYTDHASRQPV
jgi:transcriptional regulator with XRE-family HTH domain